MDTMNSWRQERLAEIVKSWKSYICFSADYRNDGHLCPHQIRQQAGGNVVQFHLW